MHSSIVFDAVNSSINIWKNNLLPSMFTFYILSDVLINYGLIEILSYILYYPLNRIMGFNNNEIYVFFMSMLLGFPGSAKLINSLLENNSINKEEGQKLILFTHFSNPLFILNIVSISILNNKKIGIYVLLSHYLGNIIIALLLKKKKRIEKPNCKIIIKEKNFMKLLTNSINNTIDTSLLVLGIITVFSIISCILELHLNNNLSLIISMFLELTKGLNIIKDTSLTIYYKGLLSTILLSFGGICVHMQVFGILAKDKIKYVPFLIARIFHSIISGFIYIIMMHL